MKKEFQICTVVRGENLVTFLKNLKKAQTSAAMVELRADSVNDFNKDDIPILNGPVKVPSIFTFRHEKEGGLFTGSVSKQKEILNEAFHSDFTYVDVAYDNPILKDLSAKEKKHLLISYHNNRETPYIEELEDILNDMRSVNPAIMKIATFVNNHEDVPILAALLKLRKKGEKLIVIGMGKKGIITRLMFPPMGSCIAFVTMKGQKNMAPGMITEADLLKNMARLKNKKAITL
jgi:3-dehydroquinate dehydratase-1